MAKEYIERGAAYNAIVNNYTTDEQLRDLDAIPAADVAEVRHGRWEKKQHAINWSCSLCGNEPFHCHLEHMNYCPNCGADMREES